MKSFLTLQSVDQILARISDFPPLCTEYAALDKAVGKRMAEGWCAPGDLPGFDRSTVDGYAVRATRCLRCAGSVTRAAGMRGGLPYGRCSGILSSRGADGPYSDRGHASCGGGLRGHGGIFTPGRRRAGGDYPHARPGDNILVHDEDAARGAELIPAGRMLRPQEIGLLAAFGEEQVMVRRAARVVIISTGDEVVPIDRTPAPGQIRDVNSHSLAALCRGTGAEVRMAGLVRDDPARLRAVVDEALADADVIVVSGGSSAGMRDHTVEVFTSVPGSVLLAHGAAISPGKPFILARAGSRCMMGLPGHVASALICARVFLLPLLHRLHGREGEELLPRVPAVLSRAVASAQGRRDFIRVRLRPGGGRVYRGPRARSFRLDIGAGRG